MSGIQKIAAGVLYVLAGLSILFAAFYFFGGDDPSYATEAGTTVTPKSYTDLALIWTVVLAVLITVLTLGFSILAIVTSPKALKGFGISLVAGVVLVGISYALADKSEYVWVGTGINLTIILAVIAFVGIIASEVYRAIK
ncbi:MAG: hypothetical protein JW801_19150 [Bacteroidales bacterium]|nr:hypothetical protein [Bacteroidales bacterium]